VLQRTRCSYFRDTSYSNCNKRDPGSGCAALDGINRTHAILGTSERCIATYPGDFAQALIALDARVEVMGRSGSREFPFANLHRQPGQTPHLETTLAPGELITAFRIGRAPFTRRSLFLKVGGLLEVDCSRRGSVVTTHQHANRGYHDGTSGWPNSHSALFFDHRSGAPNTRLVDPCTNPSPDRTMRCTRDRRYVEGASRSASITACPIKAATISRWVA
jgi:hypothetical protein